MDQDPIFVTKIAYVPIMIPNFNDLRKRTNNDKFLNFEQKNEGATIF